MGKKKGKKGKKSGKGSAKSIKSAINDGTDAKERDFDTSSKEFWQKQVDDLERQVVSYQKTCDLLDVNNLEKVNRLEQLDVEKNDIHNYLANTLEKKIIELQELTAKLLELQQVKDAEKESYEAQLLSLEKEFQETKEALGREQENLTNKLASMKEYEVQRDELMRKFAHIEKELDRQLNEQHKVIYDLERQMVVDKDRLRKEAQEKVSTLSAEFRKVSDKQMEDTKKRALRENVLLNKSLQKHSDRTISLIEENDAYKYRAKRSDIIVEMLEFNEKELSRKFQKNIQNIRVLLDKTKGMEALISEYEEQNQKFEVTIEEHRETLNRMAKLEERHSNAFETNESLKAKMQELKVTTADEGRKQRKLEALLIDTAKAIKQNLEQQAQLGDEEKSGAAVAQREVVIHHLMRILNSASNMGVGPSADEFQVQKPSLYTTVKSNNSTSKSAMNSEAKDNEKMVGAQGYKLGGVLGLVPPPRTQDGANAWWHMKGGDAASTTTSAVFMKRSQNQRSIACQTVSVPKAIFLARRRLQSDDDDHLPIGTHTNFVGPPLRA